VLQYVVEDIDPSPKKPKKLPYQTLSSKECGVSPKLLEILMNNNH